MGESMQRYGSGILTSLGPPAYPTCPSSGTMKWSWTQSESKPAASAFLEKPRTAERSA